MPKLKQELRLVSDHEPKEKQAALPLVMTKERLLCGSALANGESQHATVEAFLLAEITEVNR